MALVPEYLFPSYPYGFRLKNGQDYPFGVAYAGTPDGSYDWNLTIPMFVDVDVTECKNQTGIQATPFEILRFPNNMSLVFFVEGPFSRIGTYMAYKDDLYTPVTVNGFIPGVDVPGPNPVYTGGSPSSKIIMHCFLYVLFLDATENVGPASWITFNYFIASYNDNNPSGGNLYQYCDWCYNGVSGWFRSELCQVEYEVAGTGVMNQYTVYPATSLVLGSSAPLGRIEDLNAFNEGMRNAGDGMTGDVTKPDPPGPEDDTSGTGGGGGSYDPTSDPIDFPDLPTGGALTSGMIKGFVISSQSLISLQQKLWDMSIFDIATQFQKLVNQPLDCLISLHCLPCLPTVGQAEAVKLGSFDTGVTALRITNQYLVVNGGTLKVPKYWGSALDYAPFSRAEIYLPFIGIRNLQIEDIQGLTLTIKYHVDVLTGDCVCYIKCGASVLYTFTGSCISHIPATSQTSDLLSKNIGAVGMVGVGIATGNAAATVAGAAAGAINSATAKNHVQRSGEVAGSPGVMSEFTPYIIFHRPKQSLAKNYNHFKGFPTNITYTLSSLSGYTEIEHVHLTGIKATDTELQEIESLLKSGVII